MNPKKIILCPNPSRDRGMEATKAAQKLLHEIGFRTVVCSPFRDQRDGAFADFDVRPLQAELRSADLLLTFGGDGTILHLAKLAALNKIPVLGVNMGGLGFIAELEAGELELLRKLESWDFELEQRMMLDVRHPGGQAGLHEPGPQRGRHPGGSHLPCHPPEDRLRWPAPGGHCR